MSILSGATPFMGRELSTTYMIGKRAVQLALAFLVFSTGILSAATSLPSGFVETQVGGFWPGAAGITFDEAGVMYGWDREGKVWIFQNGNRLPTPLIDISEEVGNWYDHGMLGMALHPNFRQNGYIYLLYVVDRHHLMHFGTPNYSPSVNDFFSATISRVTRYTANAADNFRTVNPASRKVLVGETRSTGIPLTYITHGIGSLVFGTDGTLLVSCGDGAMLTDYGSSPDSYYAQALADGIIRPKENVGAFRSQLVDSLNGKILRIDPQTGDGLPSNPFYDSANPRAPRSRVWSLGLRNPFRFTVKPGTGSHNPVDGNPGVLYIGDVGYFTWEKAVVATGPGLNFGWPIYEGYDGSPSYDGADQFNRDAPNPLFGVGGCTQQFFSFRDLLKAATLGPLSWPNPCNPAQQIPSSIPRFVHTRPVFDWKHGSSGPSRTGIFIGTNAATINIGAPGSPVSGPQFDGNCSIGGIWYEGLNFPSQYTNKYFFADFDHGWIRYAVFNASNQPVSIHDFASGISGLVGIFPDQIGGGFYYVNVYDGLRKISYTGNQPPKAVASSDLRFGTSPLTVAFTGSSSTDPEGVPLTYRWNFGDGSPIGTLANPVHTFNAPTGVPTRFDVTLTVIDSGGQSNTTALIIGVNNSPPAVTILTPTDGSLYPMTGQTTYNLTASVSDAEHSPDQLLYQWQTFLHHNAHHHSNPVDTNHSTTTVIVPAGCDTDIYYYRIALTVTDAAGLSTSREVRLYPDCSTNNAPIISNIPDQTVNSGQSTPAIPFAIGDAETNASSLQLTKSSSDLVLLPTANIVFGGSGSNRTVTVTPAVGQFGTAFVTVNVSDGVFTVSDTFMVTVFPANNTPPTIMGISNRAVDEDTSTGPITFTIDDPQTGPANLILSKSSSNPSLVPTNNIVFGGSGANRTVSVTPAANQSGTATITLGVSDGQFTTNTSFVLTVNAVNDPPTVSDITDKIITGGGSTGPISFTIGDVETAAANLNVSATSSDPGLTAILGGSGTDRTVMVNAVGPVSSPATITVNVSDSVASVSDTFTVTVSAVVTQTFSNSAPVTIPHVGAATPYPSVINVSGMPGSISQVTVRLNGFSQTWPNDVDIMLVGPTGQKVMLMSDAGGGNGVTGVNLILADSAPAGLPQSAVIISGTYKPTDFEAGDAFPAPAPTGAYATTLSALDGLNPNGAWSLYALDDGPGDQGGLSGGWSLTITTGGGAPSAVPTISDIANQATPMNTSTGPIPFTVGDSDTPLASLTLSGSSSNIALVPNGNIVFGGSGANRTVMVTPATGQSGSSLITVTVSDGVNTASDTFLLSVQPANNTPPTVSTIPNQTVDEDSSTAALPFTVGDAETAAASLILSTASSNGTLVPTNNIVFGGSGANRTVVVTPAPNQSGTATITIGVSDGQFTTNTSFAITVNPVNDLPTISNVADQTISPGGTTGPLTVTIGDAEVPATSLTLTSSSSNPTVVPDQNVVISGTGANRSVTVTGAPGQVGASTITLTVSDGANTASDTFVVTFSSAVSLSFTNSTPVIIPHVGAASPYPSVINVSGLGGTITDVSVRLNGFAQTWPNDVDLMLVGPGGQKVMIMSDVGGGNWATGINLHLTDSAPTALPQDTALSSGTFKPTDFPPADTFPAPAPAGPYTTTLSTFDGLSANGAWSLYAVDDGAGDEGSLTGGWSLTITTIGAVQQTPQVTWPSLGAITYGAPLSGAQLSATADVPGTFIYTPAAGTVPNAGLGQVISLTFTPSDTVNYRAVTTNKTIDVLQRPLQITADNKGRLYGAANPPLTASFSGFVNGDGPASLTTSVTLATAATPGSPVGTHTITASGATSPNYAIAHVNGTLTISPAPLTITADDKTRILSEPNPPLTASYAGLVNGDTAASLATPVSLSTTATAGSPIGSYPITASGATSPNYAITHVNGTLTITPQNPPGVTLSTNILRYTEGAGAVVVDGLATVTDSDSADFDGGNLTLGFTAFGAAEDRLAIRSQGAINISGSDVSYEGSLIGTVSGGQDGATPLLISLNTGATPTAAQALLRNITYENVSATPSTQQRTLQVTASDGDGGTSIPKTIAIAITGVPEDSVVTWASPAPITYGTPLSAAQLNATANVPGTFAYTPTTGAVLNASNAQTLRVTFTPSDTINYRSVTQTTTIDVLRAPLTVTAVNKTKAYGSANPPLTAGYSGFLNGDGPSSLTTPVSLSTTATAASPIGDYAITASGATAANYSITHVNGTLSVTPASLTITADNKTRIVGEPNPPLTASYTGFVNGETPAVLITPVGLSTSATIDSPAGSYLIVASGATAANYAVTHVNGTLTVTPPGGTFSFSNPAPITIPHVGTALPYPSVINVTGLGGSVTQVVVTLNSFVQTWANDVDVLLVGPTGQKVMVMSDVGGGNWANGVTLTLSDSAATALPQSTPLVAGTFKPTDFEPGDAFPAPVPAGPYATTLSAFNELNPNGAWSLYVIDDGPGDLGSFAGWSLAITTAGPAGPAPVPPTISDIANQSTTMNTATAAIPFTVSDSDTPIASLTLSGSSSNQALVPNGNIVFGGSGANRTLTVTPATGQSGSATITITVSDGANTASDSFVLTVNVPNNTPPTISSIADQTIDEDVATGAINLTIGDVETAAGSLTVTRGSSNPALVPTNSIVLAGTGASRTVTITPAANQSGTATITLSVSDGQATTSTSFLVTVSPINDPPTISNISDQAIAVNTSTGPLSFTIGDIETPAASLQLSADSSNQGLVPLANITFGGAGANRTVTVVPVADQTGSATITVTVSDGVSTATDTFVVSVSSTVTLTQSFANAALITINHVGAATPYPSTISVGAMAGTITEVVARLHGFSHQWENDVDVLLVGPGGQSVMLMSDSGEGFGVNGANLTFSASAPGYIPLTQITSGTYRPTDYGFFGDPFPAPAPTVSGPYGTNLAVFNGLSPNGAWSLYVVDDGAGDQGSITSGWSLTITSISSTSPGPAQITGIAPTISITRPGTDGSVVLTVTAQSGATCVIEASPDLQTWKTVGTVQSESGTGSFTDLGARHRPQLFYRVVTQP